MMPSLLQRMLPPGIVDCFTSIPKVALVDSFVSERGDKALIERCILSASATAVNEDTWPDIPSAEDAEELAILVLRLADSCTATQRNRITKLLQRGFGNPLLLFLCLGNEVYLSARFKEHIVSTLLPSELPDEFVADMDITHGFPANLRVLYNRWVCALYALRLCTNKKLLKLVPLIRYAPSTTPDDSILLQSQLHALMQDFFAIQAELKSCQHPGRRVELGNSRHLIKQNLLSLFPL